MSSHQLCKEMDELYFIRKESLVGVLSHYIFASLRAYVSEPALATLACVP